MKNPFNLSLKLLFFSALGIIITNQANAQEYKFKPTSITTEIGIGFNETDNEAGVGLLSSVGWQKSFGKKRKFRINPNLLIGIFAPFITGTIQSYMTFSPRLNIHYDLIRLHPISIVTTIGGFLSYSRGISGRIEQLEYNFYDYKRANSFYFGLNGSLGIRVNPRNSRLAYNFNPINVCFRDGNKKYFLLGHIMFGIDIKLDEY